VTDSSAPPTSLADFDERTSRGPIGRLFTKAMRIATAPSVLALADQALVSGASFVTTVLIGRYTFPSQLGTYALAGAILIWLTNAQESLVSLPYTIRQSADPALAAIQAGQALVLSSLLSTLVVVTIGFAIAAAFFSGTHKSAIPILWALAGAAPFVIHRDFARRFAFANLRNIEALALDCAIVTLQLGILGWLAWTGRLTSVTALAALGIACAASVLLWLGLVHARFRFTSGRFLETLRDSWTVGKWLFANQLLAALQSQMTLWFVALAVGTAATGVYTACMSVALFANPIILGLSNMLWAKAARAFQEGGSGRLLRESIADAAQLGAIIGIFCLAMLFWGEDVLSLLYPHNEYGGHGNIVIVLAFGQLLYGIGMPASTALAGMGHVRTNFLVALVETALIGALVWPLVLHWGLIGAAYGILIGCALRLFIRWGAVVLLLRATDRTAVSEAALETLTPILHRLPKGAEPLKVETLDLNGCQGHIFAAMPESSNRYACCAHIIKIYRPDRDVGPAEIRAQYEALHSLNAYLDRQVICGWTIYVPTPVLISEVPLALVMAQVPGRKLVGCLYGGATETAAEHSATAAVAAAMMKLWAAGLSHGDLTVENILCDEATQSLSFVDCGPKPECSIYAARGHGRDLAIHDLAHLLAHEGETVLMALGRSKWRQRRLFIEGMLRAALAAEPSHAAGSAFLSDLGRCAQAHLVAPTSLRRGLWQALKRTVASARIKAILGRMEREIATSPYPAPEASSSASCWVAPNAALQKPPTVEERHERCA
jgi:O-antigen/teichoic acid export membrane protein